LKLMFDEGLLDEDLYKDRVELMLDKYGFKWLSKASTKSMPLNKFEYL
jgi:hypothetical protein